MSGTATKTKKRKAKAEACPVVRGNVAFVAIKEIGELDEKGKKVLAIGYGGKVEAKEDHPLALVRWFVRELMPHCRYSSKALLLKDLKDLRKMVDDLVKENE